METASQTRRELSFRPPASSAGAAVSAGLQKPERFFLSLFLPFTFFFLLLTPSESKTAFIFLYCTEREKLLKTPDFCSSGFFFFLPTCLASALADPEEEKQAGGSWTRIGGVRTTDGVEKRWRERAEQFNPWSVSPPPPSSRPLLTYGFREQLFFHLVSSSSSSSPPFFFPRSPFLWGRRRRRPPPAFCTRRDMAILVTTTPTNFLSLLESISQLWGED